MLKSSSLSSPRSRRAQGIEQEYVSLVLWLKRTESHATAVRRVVSPLSLVSSMGGAEIDVGVTANRAGDLESLEKVYMAQFIRGRKDSSRVSRLQVGQTNTCRGPNIVNSITKGGQRCPHSPLGCVKSSTFK